MSEYLSDFELYSLTGQIPTGKQAAWLSEHAIPRRVDGRRVIVSRVHVQSWLEGRTVVHSTGLNLAGIK